MLPLLYVASRYVHVLDYTTKKSRGKFSAHPGSILNCLVVVNAEEVWVGCDVDISVWSVGTFCFEQLIGVCCLPQVPRRQHRSTLPVLILILEVDVPLLPLNTLCQYRVDGEDRHTPRTQGTHQLSLSRSIQSESGSLPCLERFLRQFHRHMGY